MRPVPPSSPTRRPRRRTLAITTAAALAFTGLSVPAYAATADEDEFSVTIESRGDGQAAGGGSFAPGETVTLSATPADGHVWEGWTSSELDWIGARTTSFTMPAEDVELSTAFRPRMGPLKDIYADHFDVGSIWSGSQTYAPGSPNSETMARHFSVVTAENAMKPESLLPNANIDPTTGAFTFSFGTADSFVNTSRDRGMTVHGHVLVWHSQSPARLTSGATGGTRELARENMRRYIEGVLGHFSNRIETWDVVNEAFIDGIDLFDPATQDWRDYLRGGPNGGQSGWYSAYANGADAAAGESPADFIYDAFVFAREYGPEARLEYNDFNVFQSAGKARAIIAMASDLNARYAQEHPDDPRLLIEAIGMQSHNYITQTPAFACSDTTQLGDLVDDSAAEWRPGACSNHASVERSIQQIVDAGLGVVISELDLMVWEAWNAEPEGSSAANYRDLTDPSVKDRISKPGFTYWVDKIGNRAELEAIQAQRFAEYFSVYKQYSEHISRVTFWGLTDRLNWRATHNPLFLNQDWSEKLGATAIADPEGWYARQDADDDGIPIEVEVPGDDEPGALTMTVAEFGDGVVLGGGDLLGDRRRFTGGLPTITVTDSRNAEQAGSGGWALNGQAAAFVAQGATLGAEHLGWTPALTEERAGVQAGDPVATALSGGPGLADPALLASASADGRQGSVSVDAALRLDVPVDTAPGTYRSSITISLFADD